MPTDVFVPSSKLLALRIHRRLVYDANRQQGNGCALICMFQRWATTELHGGVDMHCVSSRAAVCGPVIRVVGLPSKQRRRSIAHASHPINTRYCGPDVDKIPPAKISSTRVHAIQVKPSNRIFDHVVRLFGSQTRVLRSTDASEDGREASFLA